MAACGGGVDDSKKLSDLSTEEAKDVCLDLAADFPERMVTCSGVTITIGLSEAECNTPDTAPATCTATVGDVRACNKAMYELSDAELCSSQSLPAACAKLEGC